MTFKCIKCIQEWKCPSRFQLNSFVEDNYMGDETRAGGKLNDGNFTKTSQFDEINMYNNRLSKNFTNITRWR